MSLSMIQRRLDRLREGGSVSTHASVNSTIAMMREIARARRGQRQAGPLDLTPLAPLPPGATRREAATHATITAMRERAKQRPILMKRS